MLATLVGKQPLTDSITSFHFKPETPLDHIAGQFAEFTLAHGKPDNPDSKGTMRQFTISSSPTEEHLSITVRRSDSSFKQALWQMQPGDTIRVSQLLGDFVLPLNTKTPLIWIAGGIGITPFRSMARSLADQHEQRPIHLFHSVNKPEEALFEDEFLDAGIIRSVVNTALIGRTDAKNILQSQAMYYVSGPESFVAHSADGLRQHQIPSSAIITDDFLGYKNYTEEEI